MEVRRVTRTADRREPANRTRIHQARRSALLERRPCHPRQPPFQFIDADHPRLVPPSPDAGERGLPNPQSWMPRGERTAVAATHPTGCSSTSSTTNRATCPSGTGHTATAPTAGPDPRWAAQWSGQRGTSERDRIARGLHPRLDPRTDPGRRERVARLMIPQAGHLPKRPTCSVTDPGSSSLRPQDVGRSADRRANRLRTARADANLGGTARRSGKAGFVRTSGPPEQLHGDIPQRCGNP
jgi:hypothetical protein